MKNRNLLMVLICAVTLIGSNSSVYAQSVREECKNGNCDEGLNCVNVRIKGTDMKLCSECTQSELKAQTTIVNAKCKYFEEGQSFSLRKNPKYLDAISNADSDQPRVPAGIYDEVLNDIKECKTARTNRDNKCWDGGNSGHIQQVSDLTNIQRKIQGTKSEDYNKNAIFYCSESSYNSAFGYYKSTCSGLNTSTIESALDRMESELNRGNEIDCDDLKEYIKDCEDCRKKAYDLIRTAFDGSSSKTPDKIQSKMDDSEALVDMGEELLKKAESKDLCD